MTHHQDVLFREAYQRLLTNQAHSPDLPNIQRNYAKLFGIGEWMGKVYSWPQSILVHEIDNAMLTEFSEARLREGLKPASVNVEIRNIRRAYKYALASMRSKHPMEPLKFKLLKTKEKSRFIKVSEERMILRHLSAKADRRTYAFARDLYIVLVDTGVRISEALSIRKKDIDLDEGVILIYRHKTGTEGLPAMTPRMRKVIEERLKECKTPSDLLFQRPSKGVAYLRKAINDICNADPIEINRHGRATIHSLRDTFASRLVMNEMSLYTVSTLLGHTTTQMTRKYAHLEAKTKAKQAAEILSSVCNSGSNQQ